MASTNSDDFLTLTEAAKLVRAPESSVRYWIREGRLKSYRPGKRLLIKRSELIAFIESTASTVV